MAFVFASALKRKGGGQLTVHPADAILFAMASSGDWRMALPARAARPSHHAEPVASSNKPISSAAVVARFTASRGKPPRGPEVRLYTDGEFPHPREAKK